MQYRTLVVAIVIAAISWIIYRLYRRWTRRCEHCGSVWRFVRWHEREFVRDSTSGKFKGITTTYYKCNNPVCSNCGIEFVLKSYPKEFPASKMTY
jgi:hypothetical protein